MTNTVLTFGKVEIDALTVNKAQKVYRAFNHKLRQQLMDLIAGNPEITVTEMYIRLRIEQSVCSQHLAILRRAGLLGTTRTGKFIAYHLNEGMVSTLNEVSVILVNALKS